MSMLIPIQSECRFGISRVQYQGPTRHTFQDPFQFSHIQTVLHSQWIFVETRSAPKNQFYKYFTTKYSYEALQRFRVHWTSQVLLQSICISKLHNKVGIQVLTQGNSFQRLLDTLLRDLTSLLKSLFLRTYSLIAGSVINYWVKPPSPVILSACYLPHPFLLIVIYIKYFLQSFVCQAFKHIVMIQADIAIFLRSPPLSTVQIFTFQFML